MKNLWTKFKAPSMGTKSFYAIYAAVMMAMLSVNNVFALGNIANAFSNTFSEIYSAIMVIATITAVTLCAICLLLRMISKNPRTAEEATSWIKRIVVCWLCLMLLSLFLRYGLTIVNSAGADTATPWN